MPEQLLRKVELDGNPQGSESKRDFGVSLADAFDSLEEFPVKEEALFDEPQPKESDVRVKEAEQPVPEEGKAEAEVQSETSEDDAEVDSNELGDIEIPSIEEDGGNVQQNESEEPLPEKEEGHTRADDEDAKADIKELKEDPHVPAKTKKTIDRLLGKIKHLDKLIREKNSEIEAVKTATPEVTETKQLASEELQELTMLRRRYALEKDQTLATYDEKIKGAESMLLEIAKQNLDEDSYKEVERVGFKKFAQAKDSFRRFMEFVDEQDPAQAALLRTKYAELVSAEREKGAKTNELLQESNKWWEEQEANFAEQKKQREAAQKQIESIKTDFFTGIVSSDPMFKPIDTKGLKGEQLTIANLENARKAAYQADLKKILGANTIEEQKKAIYRAALARPLSDMLKKTQAELKEARAKLKKIEESRTIKSSSGHVPAPRQEEPMDFVTALERLAGGQ